MNKEEIKNKINIFIESKNFKYILYIFGAVFILFFVFQMGMMIGFRKASFSRDWGNNYERNFGPMRKTPPFMRNDVGNLPNAHGAIGKIIKVDYPNIVVLDKDQTEKIVIINDQTNIIERKEKVSKDILVVDKFIIVIGNPNVTGQIEAKLIRVLPAPEEMPKLNMSEFNSKNI